METAIYFLQNLWSTFKVTKTGFVEEGLGISFEELKVFAFCAQQNHSLCLHQLQV